MDRRGVGITAMCALGTAILLAWASTPATHLPHNAVAPPLLPPAPPAPGLVPAMPRHAPPHVADALPPPSPQSLQSSVLPPTTEGLATAVLLREDQVADCLAREVELGRPFEQRPTIQLTVHDAGTHGLAQIMLLDTADHRAEAEACLSRVFADSVWEVPERGETTVSWRAAR